MSPYTVSVDPGLRGCGVAVFKGTELIWASYIRSLNKEDRGPKAWYAMAMEVEDVLRGQFKDLFIEGGLMDAAFVFEVPQIYRGAQLKGDPDDLLQLVGVEAWVAGLLRACRVVGYRPREWKGQVPKDVHVRRIENTLTDEEKACMQKCPASLRHNMLDGIGIGLFHVRRLQGQGVPRAA